MYSIYKVGSKTIPYIKNPNDVDLIALNCDCSTYKSIYDKYSDSNTHLIMYYKTNVLEAPVLYWGVEYYMQLIDGEDVCCFPEDFNNKEWIKKHLKRYFKKYSKNNKRMYQLLLSCFRLENKLDSLTDAEKEWVQLCHDGQCPDDCYNYMKKLLA